ERSCRRLQISERRARHLPVVERDRAVGELLPLLVPFARYHDHVARRCRLDRPLDRRAAVELDLQVETVDDLGGDRSAIFAARMAWSSILRAGAAAAAAGAFSTLELPGSLGSASSSSPARKVIACVSSLARRRPYSSPTLTTVCRACANSRRLASKYSSIVPW